MRKFCRYILLMALAFALMAPLSSVSAQRRTRPNRIPPGIDNPLPGQRPLPRARRNQPPVGPGQKEKIQRMLIQAIGLTQEQRLRMAEIRQNNEDNVISAERRFRQTRNALDRAIMNEEYDENLINRRIEEFVAAQAEATRQRAQVRAQLRRVLTTEQIIRFHQLEREWMQKQREQRQQDREQKDGPDRQALSGPGSEFEGQDFVTWLIFGR